MSRTINITDKFIKSHSKFRENCGKSEKQDEFYDQRERGLSVRFSANGTVTFNLLYRFAGRSRRLSLGRYPENSLAEARDLARSTRASIQKGIDPAHERQRRKQDYESTLFPNLLQKYIEEYAKKKTKSWNQTEATMTREFVKLWSKMPIDQLNKMHCREVLQAIEVRSPSSGRNAAAYLRKFLKWAVAEEYIPESPFPPSAVIPKIPSRERVLSKDELIQMWKATEDIPFPYGPFVQLLALTGQRRGEWASAEWSEIDFETGLWTIPAAKNKSGRTHVVPLGPNALRILASLPRFDSKFVFPARSGSRAISGFSKWKTQLDATAGVTNWRLHDIRRTFATMLSQEASVPQEIIGRILNHSAKGVTAVYNRNDYLDLKREALRKWDEYVATNIARK
jgi:integrase